MIKFSVSYNNKVIKTYELDDQVLTIGRLPENQICISNMGISRRHAKIERDLNKNLVISDLNSLNSTFVNNNKITQTVLSVGDIITIGKYTIVLESDEPLPDGFRPGAAAQEPAVENPRPEEETDVPSAKELTSLAGDQATATSAVSAVLIETNKHVVYKIDKPLITLGASENDDIFVSGFMVGEGHIEIDKKDTDLCIRSNKFMGKFKVNGKKRKNHILHHKDRIEIGTSVFRYMENGQQAG
ncbi:MAG TPA: FHA domain-containing protein [Chitinivibrionales bacterium]